MQNLQVFKNDEFGTMRTVNIEGEPYFVGKDVAEILGYANSRKAIIDHVDDEDKGVTKCDTLGGVQELTIINESGLYSLILSSKLPTAKKFKRWATNEVLPSMRKHGMYAVDDLLNDKRDGVTIRDSIDRVHEQTAVNEIVLLLLILSSKLPTAKKFNHSGCRSVLEELL